MNEIVGGVVTVALGVIVVAAIYQLGKGTNPEIPAAQSVANNALSNLYK